jgi:hypothetical protein
MVGNVLVVVQMVPRSIPGTSLPKQRNYSSHRHRSRGITDNKLSSPRCAFFPFNWWLKENGTTFFARPGLGPDDPNMCSAGRARSGIQQVWRSFLRIARLHPVLFDDRAGAGAGYSTLLACHILLRPKLPAANKSCRALNMCCCL